MVCSADFTLSASTRWAVVTPGASDLACETAPAKTVAISNAPTACQSHFRRPGAPGVRAAAAAA